MSKRFSKTCRCFHAGWFAAILYSIFCPAASAQVSVPGQNTSAPTTSPSLPSTPVSPNATFPANGRGGSVGGSGADPSVTYPSLPTSLVATTPGAVAIQPTMEQVIAQAARRNPGLLAVLKSVFAARAGVNSARPLAAPNFFIAPSITPGGVSDGFIYEQPLELNGTRSARVRLARAGLSLAEAQAVVQLQSLVYTARQSFYALAHAQAQLALAKEYLVLAQQFDQAARRLVELGARPGIERTQTAIEVSRAQIQAAQFAGEEQAARNAFNAYLGRAPLDPVGPLENGMALADAVEKPALPIDLVAAQQQALAHRAEIALVAANRDALTEQAQLDRAGGRPDLALQLRAGDFTHGARDAGIGAVFTIPLDYGTRRERIRQETLNARAEGDRLAGVQSQVRLEALQAAARLDAARTNVQIYGNELIGNARKALDETRFGFQEGRSSILAVLEAQRTFRSLSGERANALSVYAQSQADLDRALGRTPPDLLASLLHDFQSHKAAQVKTVVVDAAANLSAPDPATASGPLHSTKTNPAIVPTTAPTRVSTGSKNQK